jgi:F0F1-type ATP synthase membrane subunit b/b'
MTLAIIILFVAFCIVLWWFKRLYDKKLTQIQVEWMEYISSELQDLTEKLARVEQEVKQKEDGQ